MNFPYIDIHTHSREPEPDVLKIFSYTLGYDNQGIPNIPFAAGIHPWHANSAKEGILDFFNHKHTNLVAIGEIGLDFAAKDLDKASQLKWFATQLKIAEKLKLPVIIHCVKAYSEVMRELGEFNLKGVVMHSFSGNQKLAEQLISRGIILSIGTNSLRSYKTIETIKNIDVDCILAETDDDNENIKNMYAKIAEIKNTDIDVMKKSMYNSYLKIIK